MSSPAGEPRTYPHGVPCWVDTDQPDVGAALEFYGQLFGWTFEDVMPPDAPVRYVIAQLGGRDAAAIGSGEDGASWHTFVAVDDVDAAADRLAGLGARVTSPPADAGPGGRAASLTDPQGSRFHLWQARRRLGAQALNEPGAWNFSNLHTTDPAAARRFYGEGLGWRFVDQDFGTAIQVPGYGDHLEATVDPGIRARQAGAPDGFEDVVAALVSPPAGASGWQVVFAVADRDASAALVERLGGTVLDSGDDEWTRTARVRDPQGAELTLSQFTPPDSW